MYGALVSGNYFVVWPSILQHLARGDQAGVPPMLWRISDLFAIVGPVAAQTLFVLFVVSSWTMWRIRGERRTAARHAGVFTAMSGSSAIAAIVLGFGSLPWAMSQVGFAMSCKVTTLESVASPDARYRASLVESVCPDDTRRHVLLTRSPNHFHWAAQPVLVLNDRPSLHLSWSDHTLLISGNRTAASMNHPLPNPWCCYGRVTARYVGSQ